jgi:hypothetical protein
MGFFTRFPEAIRHLGLPWRQLSPAPTAFGTRAVVPTLLGTGATPATGVTAPGANTPKLRTICTADGRVGQRSQSVRVVISGRMADVCAELDRLVALEAQPTLH